jgi:site-specific recombinase XerD
MNHYSHVETDFVSPMLKLRPPRLPKLMPRVLELDEIRAVLGTCQGASFEDRRDNAIIRVLFDSGARRHEVVALRYSPIDPEDRDVDLRRGLIHIVGTGAKDNHIALGNRTMLALEDYLRARRKHPHADEPWLWIARKGRLTDSGLAQAIRDRGRRVGIANLHAHDFRHAATHHELAGGMNESDVMSKRGWDSAAMLRRYASTTANARAIEASRKLGLGDKL